jgi:hypothetical protein
MRIELHVRKHRDSDWLQAVTADWYRKRDGPWDAANPDLRGFNIQRPSEEALLASLPAALKTFLEHLGFTVKGNIVVARDRDADIANLWPALYGRPANWHLFRNTIKYAFALKRSYVSLFRNTFKSFN